MPSWSREAHADAVRAIRDAIARGDTYQVNLTFPLLGRLRQSPFELFVRLVRRQGRGWPVYLDLGRFAVCSASPEVLVALRGDCLLTRPMKGTARRGLHPAADGEAAAALARSPKDRAENVMIVDMMRNDLGRIARPGTVRVDRLWDVETYPTVHQLTSTVTARSDAPLGRILGALFPSASITGAPKVAATRIIRRLEPEARGVYTGTVGWVAPPVGGRRRTRLNVAIRTLLVDRESETLRYGTGGGIVWDSDADAEYEECRTKAFVLRPGPAFELLETLRWHPVGGFFLLRRHLDRLLTSAARLGFSVREATIRGALADAGRALPPRAHRIRLTVDAGGRPTVQTSALETSRSRGCRVVLDDRPVDSRNLFLYHKTTRREVYDGARERHPEADDVLLWNERGELTEGTVTNVLVRLDGRWWTPPVRCGLLAGTLRAELLARDVVRERVLGLDAVGDAEEIALVNSVRGVVRRVRIVEPG